MQVCRCAGSSSETLALKIPTRRFLPHDAAKGCQTKTDGEDERRARYSANTWARCIFGRYGCRLNRRQVRTVMGGGKWENGELGIGGRSWESRLDVPRRQHSHRSCRGFPRSSSLSLGVYLRKRSLTLSRARRESDLSFIRGGR